MTTYKNSPRQPILETVGRFDWEQEETLVDRRNRLPNRIRRFFRNGLWWKVLLGAFILGLFSAPFMQALLTVLGFLFQLTIFMMTFIIQFVAIFWFLSRSRMYEVYPGTEGIGFGDYRGQPELLEQAKQIVTLLRGVRPFEDAGGEPLNGLLLEGPPGTGKTWLAKAISTEAGVPFFYVDASSLQGMFIGTSSLKVMQVYGKARKAAKLYGAAVVFLDEIDSVGSRGGVSSVGDGGQSGGMGGMGGDMGILSTLLVQMSGFNQEHGWRARFRGWLWRTFRRQSPPRTPKRVLTIGATNRVNALDPALLRLGRFDKKIRVDVPDMEGRREIFEYYLSKMAHDSSMDPVILASETPDASPADIKYLLNDSLRYALFDGRRYMTYTDFRRAQPEHEMGLRSPLKHLSEETRKRIAYYQAGKAVGIRLFVPENRIARISIIRQGYHYGHVWHYPARDVYQGMLTKDKYLELLKMHLSGKAAEIEFLGMPQQSMLVKEDFDRSRDLLNRMAFAGMFGVMGATSNYSLDMMTGRARLNLVDEQARRIEETYQQMLVQAREGIREHAAAVHELAAMLLKHEEISAEEIRVFFDRYGLYTPDPSAVIDGQEIQFLPKKSISQLESGETSPVPSGAD
ncbi:MAG TPA: AAA family ATPase [Aggregatilineales bacterium]|nr:AAA family ATPase [Aggregatilineales bacterium]